MAQSVLSVVENLTARWVTIQTCPLIGEMLCGRAGLDQSKGNSTCSTNSASYPTQALQIINLRFLLPDVLEHECTMHTVQVSVESDVESAAVAIFGEGLGGVSNGGG